MNSSSNLTKAEKGILLARQLTFVFLSITLFIYGLIAARNFLFPIAFSFLLGYLLFPVANWFEKKKVPRILANLIIIISSLGILSAIFIIAYRTIFPLAIDLPELTDKAIENLSSMMGSIGNYLGFNQNDTEELIRGQISSLFEAGSEQFQALFTATTSTIVAIGLLPVYLFLTLYYRTKFMYFLLKIAGKSRKMKMITVLRELSTVMVRYLSGVIAVVFILFFINSLGLLIVGIQYAIPLGITAALFNFIPYFGTLLGGLVPLLFAILIEGDPVLAFRVVILFIIVQFTENNILTPNIVGENVNISPFFIITGLVASSMIWGLPGMLLVVPFLASIRIVFSHVEFMKPYAYLLGTEGTSKHSIQMSKIMDRFKLVIAKIRR